jgi:thiol-disulfide isomerase/thioredoxin
MIRFVSISLTCLVLLSVVSCARKVMRSQIIERDNIKMLYGSISKDQLYFDYPSWKVEEDSYRTFEPAIQELSTLSEKINIEIFIGTWCSDSEREVPRFFKVIEDAGIVPLLTIDLWAVDRKKTLDSNLAQLRNIERVPTFIFYRDKQEIGRIIESPDELLEQDMALILVE